MQSLSLLNSIGDRSSNFLKNKFSDTSGAVQVYERMREDGIRPSTAVVLAALKVCSSLKDLQTGKQIHANVTANGDHQDVYVAVSLMDMYTKCGKIIDAREIFDKMQQHSVVAWNTIVLGYATNGESELSLYLYVFLQEQGIKPSAVTFLAALKACGGLASKCSQSKCLEKGKIIHSQLIRSGHASNNIAVNAIVDMYTKCGSMIDARTVFDKMTYHTVVTWTTIILGYADVGEGDLALQLYVRMQEEGCKPNSVTFVAALKACISLVKNQVEGKIACLQKGRTVHHQTTALGADSVIFVRNTLVAMYSKCGSMDDACSIFNKTLHPDVVSWTVIIQGFVESGDCESALQFYRLMQDKGCVPDHMTFVVALTACASLAAKEEAQQARGRLVKIDCLKHGKAIHFEVSKGGFDSNIYVSNALIDMYAKCWSLIDAQTVFDRMEHRTVVTWNTIIAGYAETGDNDQALHLFKCMPDRGCVPDCVTYLAALKACGNLAAFEAGKDIHSQIIEMKVQHDPLIVSCLVDFYGKCGSMIDAQQVFDSINVRDLVTWTALIAGYGRQGDTNRVFYLFDTMLEEQILPDGVTFLSILSLCSRAGLVDKGKEYFNLMCTNYGIIANIEHYACMADIFARANFLEEALSMVQDMPFEPSLSMWCALLGACRKWTNVTIGKLSFEAILRLNDKDDEAYVLMANIYSSAGMWEESAQIMAMKSNALG